MSDTNDLQIHLDFSECNIGEKELTYEGLEQISLEVVGSSVDTCEVKFITRLEDGWIERHCKVPKETGVFTGYDQISQYCVKKKSGNLLLDTERQYVTIPYIGTFPTQSVLTFIGAFVLIAAVSAILILVVNKRKTQRR